jgi:acetyl esterase/lipase
MQGTPIVLWPEGAPDARGADESDIPILMPLVPDPDVTPTNSCVLLLPAGDYRKMDLQKAFLVGEWLASLGILVFILRYRTAPRYRYPAALQDTQRAIRLLRNRAEEFGISRNLIGVMGFGAGGHLAACLSTLILPGNSDSQNPLERWNTRPDALMLFYPTIHLEIAPPEFLNNLLGDEEEEESQKESSVLGDEVDELLENMGILNISSPYSADKTAKPQQSEYNEYLLERLSPHLQVSASTPPTFLVHTMNDRVAAVDHSILFAQSLQMKNVPVEIHLYEEGLHGFGLGLAQPHLATWTGLCARWLQLRGFARNVKSAEPTA